MKKQLLLFTLLAVATGCVFETHGWYGRRGWYGRGYGYGGWGPGLGVGLTIPIGGGSSGPRRPASVRQFKKIHGEDPADAGAFCSWAKKYFNPPKGDAECKRYENYINAPRTYSPPVGGISFGFGGGGYGYPYGPYGYGPYYGYPYGYRPYGGLFW